MSQPWMILVLSLALCANKICGQIVVNRCSPNPCLNGGTCNAGACACLPGYSGSMCENVPSQCNVTADRSPCSTTTISADVCTSLGCCYDYNITQCYRPSEPLCLCPQHRDCIESKSSPCVLDGQSCGIGSMTTRWTCNSTGGGMDTVGTNYKCCVPCMGVVSGAIPSDCACSDVVPLCNA